MLTGGMVMVGSLSIQTSSFLLALLIRRAPRLFEHVI